MQKGSRTVRWRAILFDLDGTMYDWRPPWEQGTHETVAEQLEQFPASGNPDVDAVVATLIHYGAIVFDEFDRGHVSLHVARRLIYLLTAEMYGWETSDQAVEDFLERYLARILAAVEPWPDLGPTVRALKEEHGMPLGVVTNGLLSEQREKLSVLGVKAYFEPAAVVASSELGYAKPDPRIFGDAVAALGVSAKETLFVGDSWENDVLGGLEAGLDVAWFNPSGKARPTDVPSARGQLHEITALADVLRLDGLS